MITKFSSKFTNPKHGFAILPGHNYYKMDEDFSKSEDKEVDIEILYEQFYKNPSDKLVIAL